MFGKSYWKTTDQGIQREWLMTNGLGGFSCGTIIGMNARRYHGLLVASLLPPVQRYLILSAVHETVEKSNGQFHLSSFQTPDYTAHGEYFLERFVHNPIPEFHYRVGTVEIVKKVCLRYGTNQLFVVYSMKTSEQAVLRLTPVVNFRNYHYLSNHQYMAFSTCIDERSFIISPSNSEHNIVLSCSEGKAIEQKNCFFYHMDYPVERERGLNATEDHFIPGYYEITLQAGDAKTITFAASLDEPLDTMDGEAIITAEVHRQRTITEKAGEDVFLQKLFLAADQFIVDRKSTNAKTIIAGYPWFTDWGRDTMIALPGLTLPSASYANARDILTTFAQYEKDGLIPNVFPDSNGKPAYNTVDAALWYFEAVYKYLQYTDDIAFIKEQILPVLQRLIQGYKNGTHFDIRMDKDYLISAGNEDTQLTWMDAKAGNWAVTPRHGKAVEINALWYNALMVMSTITKQVGQDDIEYLQLAQKVRESFGKLFWNESNQSLYDTVNEQGADSKIRPNQIMAVSLSFPVLEAERAEAVVDTVYRELYTALGLRTLNQTDPQYRGIYIGDQYTRDGAYHQGTVWTWPLGQFISGYARVYRNSPTLGQTLKTFFLPFEDHLRDACIGSISEIFDGNEPLLPRGCFAQSWSVAEILRAYYEDYLPLQNE